MILLASVSSGILAIWPYGTLKDKTSEKINWQHIEELHKVQELEWLKLDNKLTAAHVSCGKSKVYCWLVMLCIWLGSTFHVCSVRLQWKAQKPTLLRK